MANTPHHRDEIVHAFEQQEQDSLAYWNAFDRDTFFAAIGDGWSPADTVRHLIKAIRPVTRALTLPRIILRLRFGKPRKTLETFTALQTRYDALLAAGGQAGRFAPSAKTEPDLDAWRTAILHDFQHVNRELRAAILRWPDAKLDAIQLPHPLLGHLTVREMLFFTLFHQTHHIDVVRRRLTAA
jgi:hypothetical protein